MNDNGKASLVPCDLDVERAFLGAVLADPAQIPRVADLLAVDAFMLRAHRTLWQAIRDQHEAGAPIDYFATREWLARNNKTETIDDQYFVELSESFSDTANTPYYAEAVARQWRKRRLFQLAIDLRTEAAHPLTDADELIRTYGRRIEAIRDEYRPAMIQTAADVLTGLPAMLTSGDPFVATDMPALDVEIGGLRCSTLTVVGARPSIGKTSLALTWCCSAAKRAIATLFVSVEMSLEMIAERFASMMAGVTVNRLRQQSSPEDLEHYVAVAKQELVHPQVLYVSDETSEISRIVQTARIAVQRYGCRVVVVDYLQICKPEGRHATREREVGSMSEALKRFAREERVAVVAVAQLNRESERTNRPPGLADLRDSGSLEQDADLVVFLWRPDKDPGVDCRTMLRVAKNRQGPCGDFYLRFHRPTMTYSAMDAGA